MVTPEAPTPSRQPPAWLWAAAVVWLAVLSPLLRRDWPLVALGVAGVVAFYVFRRRIRRGLVRPADSPPSTRYVVLLVLAALALWAMAASNVIGWFMWDNLDALDRVNTAVTTTGYAVFGWTLFVEAGDHR